MNNQTLVTIVGLVTAFAVLVTGIIIITGVLLPNSIANGSRILIGCLMVAYGVYRSVILWMKYKAGKNQRSEGNA